MSYRVTGPVLSKAGATEFGRWLGVYAIDVTGLQVWQIGASGRYYRDAPLADMVVQTVGVTGAGTVGGAAAGAMAGSLGCAPVLGALLAPLLPYLLVAEIVALPLAWWQNYKLRQQDAEPMAAVVAKDEIVATELQFGVTGVSPARLKWTEYLIAVYGAQHQWYEWHGFRHPAQIAAGARYAAAHPGQYPRPWAHGPRSQPAHAGKLAKLGRFFDK